MERLLMSWRHHQGPVRKQIYAEFGIDVAAVFELNDVTDHHKFATVLAKCRVPDDWLLQNRRALLFGRDVLKAVMAAFTSGSQAT